VPTGSIAVLMIEDDPDYAELVQHWLSTSGDGVRFVLHWTDSLAGGFERLTRGGIDVVLLDLGLPDSSGVETFLSLRDRARGIPIVISSAGDDEPQALQFIQEGAENYLCKSTSNSQLLTRALRYAVVKRPQTNVAGGAKAGQRNTTVGVIATKGGAGATTVVCSLAAELRRQTGKPVLLADLDIQGGMASFFSGLEPKYALEEVIENLQRLDRGVWDTLITRAPLDYDFICSRAGPDEAEIPVGKVKDVLRHVRPWYAWIVLDLGRLGSFSTALLDEVDEFIVVTKTALPDLFQAKRTIEALGRLAADRERIRLVLNHTSGETSLSTSELLSLFGVDVYATLPDAGDELRLACLKKCLPPESGMVRREIADVARRMAGLPPVKSKGGLLSLARRFRKPIAGVATPGEPDGALR
jgi:Flp pilus assembly CpaE family ATPase